MSHHKQVTKILFYLSTSIALHLLVLASSSVVTKGNHQTLVIYLTDVSVYRAVEAKRPNYMTHQLDVSSGITSDSSITNIPASTIQSAAPMSAQLLKLRAEIEYELSNRLISASRGEFIVLLKFSSEGGLQSSEVSKSSGSSDLDQQIERVLSQIKIHSSLELANLKVQVPIRLL